MEPPQEGVEALKSLQDIPEEFRSLFSAFPCFNRVQSQVFDDIIKSSCSVVVTAPTGSGKTVIFELAIVKALMETANPKKLKAVYVAPVKALCSERFQDWGPRFQPLGVSCVEVTGDSDDQSDLRDHQIILTTPEKWDSLTRRWRDNLGLVHMIKLMMIDEVHLLSDKKRGPTLETIVCRMKTVIKTLKTPTSLRFIAVSATIFNLEDLAEWLGVGEECARFHRFANEMRPVALKRIVKGYYQPKEQNAYRFDIQLSYKLKPLLHEFAEGKPALIFCNTRSGVVQTCKVLVEQSCFNFTPEQMEILQNVANQITDAALKRFLRSGIGYHHAGLTFEDRTLIQDTFMQGSLPLLVATSTLAMGVNLPAHLVIIKSTYQFMAGRVEEYPESSILQMIGRAGRPQFDTSGTAVIMTRQEMVRKYQDMMDCKEVLESSLHLHLAEHLNSEIVLFTITDLGVAMDWLRCTFLYQRAFKNPKYYGLSGGIEGRQNIEKGLELMVIREINALQRAELVKLSENGIDVSPTANGRLMSHYYINFRTFELFLDVSDVASIEDMLKLLAEATELKDIQLRVNEKRLLNSLNINKQAETIRFPVPGKVKSNEMKVNVLAQACLGCLAISDPCLLQEAKRIIHILERVVKGLVDYLSRKNVYCALLSAVILGKCLHAKLWENSLFVARQLDRIGVALGASLKACGKTSFEAIMNSHPQELERIMNRGPPLGNNVINQVRHLPRYSLCCQMNLVSVLRCELEVKVQITNADVVAKQSTAGNRHAVVVIVGDSQNRLLRHKRIFDANILASGVQFRVSVGAPLPRKIFAHLISEQWVGIDVVRDVLVNPMAGTIVSCNCYLPVPIVPPSKLTKKNKRAEENKCVTNQSAALDYWKKFTKAPTAVTPKSPFAKKKLTEPMDTKIMQVASTQPHMLSINIDHGCCFDVEPDSGDEEEDIEPEMAAEEAGKLEGKKSFVDSAGDVCRVCPTVEVENFMELTKAPFLEVSVSPKSPILCETGVGNPLSHEPNPEKEIELLWGQGNYSDCELSCEVEKIPKPHLTQEDPHQLEKRVNNAHNDFHQSQELRSSVEVISPFTSEIPVNTYREQDVNWEVTEINDPTFSCSAKKLENDRTPSEDFNVNSSTMNDPPLSPDSSPQMIWEVHPTNLGLPSCSFSEKPEPCAFEIYQEICDGLNSNRQEPDSPNLNDTSSGNMHTSDDVRILQKGPPKELFTQKNNFEFEEPISNDELAERKVLQNNDLNVPTSRKNQVEVTTILSNVLSKDSLNAMSENPSQTLNTWKELEDNFHFSSQKASVSRKFPKFFSRKSTGVMAQSKLQQTICGFQSVACLSPSGSSGYCSKDPNFTQEITENSVKLPGITEGDRKHANALVPPTKEMSKTVKSQPSYLEMQQTKDASITLEKNAMSNDVKVLQNVLEGNFYASKRKLPSPHPLDLNRSSKLPNNLNYPPSIQLLEKFLIVPSKKPSMTAERNSCAFMAPKALQKCSSSPVLSQTKPVHVQQGEVKALVECRDELKKYPTQGVWKEKISPARRSLKDYLHVVKAAKMLKPGDQNY